MQVERLSTLSPRVPVAVLFHIGLTAEPYYTHAIWYRMMNALGIFRMDRFDPEDVEIYTEQPHYFWLGEVGMAARFWRAAGECGGCARTAVMGGCVLFISLTAKPYQTHAIWYGMMNALGIFRMDRLVQEDLEIYTEQTHYFWLGEFVRLI